MKTKAILLGLLTLVGENSLSQSLPYLYNVPVTAKATFDSISHYYFYAYSLTDDKSNVGKIWRFEVDISRDLNSISFDTAGLIFAQSWMEGAFRRHYPFLASRIVPVGFPSVPEHWAGGLTNDQTAEFDKDTLLLAPGQSVNGLVLMSKALPGIRRCIVRPDFEEGVLYPSIEEVDNPDSLLTVIDQDREAVKYNGSTIGPTSPPAIFNGLTFLDTLKSYVTQSRTLGWITNQATANKYTRLIDSARANLVANIRGVTKAKLDSVLLNVHADSATTLTSEAYALIRFNTEYLKTIISK